ncbi:MAG: peptidylprolyl isomerase [Gemmatimonadaceae bacterium]
MRFLNALLVLGGVVLHVAAPAAAQAPTLDELIRAEDARARTAPDLATLRAGVAAPDAAIRRVALRGLGRLERADLLGDLLGALEDPDAAVRRAAADAVAQAVSRGDGVDGARRALTARLAVERDPAVRGQLAESIGRMRVDSASVAPTALSIAALLPLRGAVRGLYFLTRQRPARGLVPDVVAARLQAVATTSGNAEDVRATAAAARIAAGDASAAELDAIRRDPSGAVRVTAATAASINDPAPVVRYRAVALAACPALVAAARDSDSHVALAALEAMGAAEPGASPGAAQGPVPGAVTPRCAGDDAAIAVLEASASPRAVVSLAALAPERARRRLDALAGDPDPFARVYASRAARRLGDTLMLRRLARDADANVASEAVDGLSALTGRADSAIYLDALRSDASQLVISAARALGAAGGPAGAREPLVAALDRITALRQETSRDARAAIIDALAALGATPPERYARDFDPVIAARAAALTGAAAAPAPLAGPPPPTVAQLRGIRRATIEMADGGRIELELFPFDAPTNSWRFARLARAGYFDDLTFHRVVPFFVVQGGSPLANEYVGDGPFTRDEVGLENSRGTVGVSTRGRDTGDGQIYFNTVDNVRLDHDYTVFARVVSGMDVVDGMMEGARIRRVTVGGPDD